LFIKNSPSFAAKREPAMSAQATTYDELPYDDKPIRATHPDNLAATAMLYGMSPTPPERCRVLELGCAAGQNLVAMAISLPDAHFTGIDLSPRQVADGQATVAALGLSNVKLRAMSLLDINDDLGQFDYILAHGVYSWVPPPVQDKLLSVCASNLAPQGVAYVSYNTYPGWHQRGMVREMMGYHVRQFAEPQQRVEQARAFLTFLIESRPPQTNVNTFHRMLTDEATMLRDTADSYLFHEHLEDVNQPLYFHDFMERASDKSLQYLDEALQHVPIESLPAATREVLAELAGDVVRLEQYLDFLRNRTFRRTLLCHAAQPLDRSPPPQRMTAFRFTTAAWPPTREVDVTTEAVVEFRGENVQVSTNNPLVKSALVELCEAWPRSLHFEALRERVWDRLKDGSCVPLRQEETRDALAGALLQCYRLNLTRLHVFDPPFVLDAGEYPCASSLARLQAWQGQVLVSNLWHAFVRLDERERVLLTHLDGSRDRKALGEAMAGGVTADERDVGWLAVKLNRLAQLGLLTG
jgi:methyltransferase-like protein/trans-aconitate methyltransferase